MHCLTRILCVIVTIMVYASCYNVYSERTGALHIITFFIERSSHPLVKKADLEAMKRVIKPENGTRSFLKKNLDRPVVPGIYAAYLGWNAVSDRNGQIIFPRKHDEDRVQVVVTRGLQPVMAEQFLVSHFVAAFHEPVAFYDFTFKADRTKKKAEWIVKKVPTPTTRIIPPYAIVIIAPPDQIDIPEGTFPALNEGNLILPTMYAKPNLTIGENALRFLNVNRYFSPVEIHRRYATTQYAEIVIS